MGARVALGGLRLADGARRAVRRPGRRIRIIDSDDGYAALDALIAMTILASTIVFALSAGYQGRRTSEAALEIRQARDLLQSVLEATQHAEGAEQGQGSRFAWRLETGQPVVSASAATLCTHTVTVTALRSKLQYSAATDVICPSGAGA